MSKKTAASKPTNPRREAMKSTKKTRPRRNSPGVSASERRIIRQISASFRDADSKRTALDCLTDAIRLMKAAGGPQQLTKLMEKAKRLNLLP